MQSSYNTPLPIRPGPVVEVGAFPADDVQAPAWRQVLQLVALAARLGLLAALLLHRQQTYAHTNTFKDSSMLKDSFLVADFVILLVLPGSSW